MRYISEVQRRDGPETAGPEGLSLQRRTCRVAALARSAGYCAARGALHLRRCRLNVTEPQEQGRPPGWVHSVSVTNIPGP